MPAAYAWQLLRRGFIFILLTAVVGVALAGLALSTRQTYATSGHILFRAATEQQGLRAAEPERFFQTQAQRVLGDEILDDAARSLGDRTSARDLRNSVSLAGGTSDDILRITATSRESEQSAARVRAVVEAVDAADSPEVSTEVLWIGAPEPALGRERLLLAGLVGGALAGAVLVILRGVVRRPILEDRLVGAHSFDIDVYPLRTKSGDIKTSCRRLLDWVDWSRGAASVPGAPSIVGVVDLAGTSRTRAVVATLTQSGEVESREVQVVELLTHEGDGRPERPGVGPTTLARKSGLQQSFTTLLVVGERGKTSELDVEERVRWFSDIAPRSILVLVDGKSRRKH